MAVLDKVLIPGQLTFQDIRAYWQSPYAFELCDKAYDDIEASFNTVSQIIEQNRRVYGINTGFGALANETIAKEDLALLQRNLVLSHACGTGDNLDENIVALMLFFKINSLSQGYSGVSRDLINRLIAFSNFKLYPCIPAKGSVGASGDLAPLAHLALPLIGEGEMSSAGQILPSMAILNSYQMSPLTLQPKEGLALLNGLQASAAIICDAFFKTECLFETALIAGMLTLDAARGSDVPFDERIQKLRGHDAQAFVAGIYRSLIKDSSLRASHLHCSKVQDPYCLRCQPQVMGAVLAQMGFVATTLKSEINSITDNPLVFSQDEAVLSGGNFHGEMLAMAADNLALAIAEIGALSERRIALLVDPHFSGLPAFLVKQSGLNSGFMIAHVTAAACASDNKALAHPHCVDSIPTSANQEDHVSMATNAGLRLSAMIDNVATILSIELLAACQGLSLHAPQESSVPLQTAYQVVRDLVPAYESDRYFAPDIKVIKQLVQKGGLRLENLGLDSIEHYYK